MLPFLRKNSGYQAAGLQGKTLENQSHRKKGDRQVGPVETSIADTTIRIMLDRTASDTQNGPDFPDWAYPHRQYADAILSLERIEIGCNMCNFDCGLQPFD